MNTGATQTKSGGLNVSFLQTSLTGAEATILAFNTERPWSFKQGLTGASTTLDLRESTGSKIFRIGSDANPDNVTISSSSGNIISKGTITATNFILSSDRRLKENIQDLDIPHIPTAWKSFTMGEDKQIRYGVIAQELEETNPEFVRTDDDGMKSVAYIDLLIAKCAEQDKRIEMLESKLELIIKELM